MNRECNGRWIGNTYECLWDGEYVILPHEADTCPNCGRRIDAVNPPPRRQKRTAIAGGARDGGSDVLSATPTCRERDA